MMHTLLRALLPLAWLLVLFRAFRWKRLRDAWPERLLAAVSTGLFLWFTADFLLWKIDTGLLKGHYTEWIVRWSRIEPYVTGIGMFLFAIACLGLKPPPAASGPPA